MRSGALNLSGPTRPTQGRRAAVLDLRNTDLERVCKPLHPSLILARFTSVFYKSEVQQTSELNCAKGIAEQVPFRR